MPTTCHCFSSSSLTQLPSAISMLYKRDLIGYVNTYKCTFKVTSRPIQNLFILSCFTAHPLFIIFSYMPPFLCSHCCCQTSAPPLYWHLPTSPPPTPSHFLSPYTLPLPLPPNSHVVVSVSSSLFCSPQLRADRWSHLCRTA